MKGFSTHCLIVSIGVASVILSAGCGIDYYDSSSSHSASSTTAPDTPVAPLAPNDSTSRPTHPTDDNPFFITSKVVIKESPERPGDLACYGQPGSIVNFKSGDQTVIENISLHERDPNDPRYIKTFDINPDGSFNFDTGTDTGDIEPSVKGQNHDNVISKVVRKWTPVSDPLTCLVTKWWRICLGLNGPDGEE